MYKRQPYAGVVTQVLVDEGAQVQRGQPMLRLQSRELVTVQAELARARAEAGVAQQQAGRDAVLLKEGLIAQARAQESAARAAIAQASVAPVPYTHLDVYNRQGMPIAAQ